MNYARRVALLRLTALVAIAASAVLTVDSVTPGRDFCPLAEACAAVRDSALGSVAGVPTSIIGMAAFGALLLLTLLPLEMARPMLKPVGAVAAVAGVGFIAFQHFVLGTFCPLCLVADGAGFVAGMLTVTWPRLPVRRSGRFIRWEGGSSRMAWTMAGLLAAVVPFAIPRAQDPGWVEITPLSEAAFEEEAAVITAKAPPPPPSPAVVAEPAPASTPDVPPSAAPADTRAIASPLPQPEEPAPTPAPPPTPTPEEPKPVAEAAPTPVVVLSPEPEPRPAPAPVRRPTPKRAPAAPKGPLLVEYLNAFCGHCRATHKRLHAVLEETGVTVRRRRIYTWGGKRTPDWARACAYAAEVGREEQMFNELLKARRQNRGEIEAAARRAGVSIQGLRVFLRRGGTPARLARDQRLFQKAGIRKLPTIDIGRRRLMGSQSAEELRSAVLAAAGRD